MEKDTIKALRAEWDDALSAIEKVLEERPGKHLEELSEAVGSLVRVRDCLIQVCREKDATPTDRQHLNQINAMLSVMASLEYPLAGLHWQRIELVREGLTDMIHASSDEA